MSALNVTTQLVAKRPANEALWHGKSCFAASLDCSGERERRPGKG